MGAVSSGWFGDGDSGGGISLLTVVVTVLSFDLSLIASKSRLVCFIRRRFVLSLRTKLKFEFKKFEFKFSSFGIVVIQSPHSPSTPLQQTEPSRGFLFQ